LRNEEKSKAWALADGEKEENQPPTPPPQQLKKDSEKIRK
jgi:hypothetical protein